MRGLRHAVDVFMEEAEERDVHSACRDRVGRDHQAVGEDDPDRDADRALQKCRARLVAGLVEARQIDQIED